MSSPFSKKNRTETKSRRVTKHKSTTKPKSVSKPKSESRYGLRWEPQSESKYENEAKHKHEHHHESKHDHHHEPKCERQCEPKCERQCEPKCERQCEPKCERKCEPEPCHKKCKKIYSEDPTPLIILEDYSNFDGFIATIIAQKAPNIDLRLLVSNYGFGNQAPSINNVFNVLSWLGNEETPVYPGTYFNDDEVALGPNPGFGTGPGDDPARVGQVAQPIYNMFVPPLWKENGSVLYGTVGKIPVTCNPERQYSSVAPTPGKPYIPPYERIAEALNQVRSEGKRAVIFNTGSHSDLGNFFINYPGIYDDAIEKIVIMGGGFFNFANPDDNTNQRWAGNIFSSEIFGLTPLVQPFPYPVTPNPPPGYNIPQSEWDVKPPFHTEQEFNIFLDPLRAKTVFDYVYTNGIETIVVPTDATDPLLIGSDLDVLKDSPTPEGRYVYDLLQGVRAFEGSNFDNVIRLWDIIAIMVLLDPSIILSQTKGKVEVDQLDPGLETSPTPYNVLAFDYQVGKTTLIPDPNSSITIVLSVDEPRVLQGVIDRLNTKLNSACKPAHF